MESVWWLVFDLLGTAAFAISGAFAAISRRMDLFGIFVLSSVTAVGGGVLRDVLLERIPPAFFRTSIYFWIITGSILLTALPLRYLPRHTRRRFMGKFFSLYLASDAVGLGSFTVTGTWLGCYCYPDYWILAITLGVLTAVGGGVLRDVLAGKIPGVLRKDVYATASLAGSAFLYLALALFKLPLTAAAVGAFLLTVVIRLTAIRFHLNIPKVRKKGGREPLS